MKKLLVLMMVLGLATSAQAAISLSLNGNPAPDETTIATSTIVTIDVTSDDTMPYVTYLWMSTPATGEWVSGVTISPEAGDDAVAEYDPYGYGEWRLTAADFPESGETEFVLPGTHFEIDFHCLAVGDALIELYADDFSTVLDTITIHQVVPEPITIGLLGLGGLLLRRRK